MKNLSLAFWFQISIIILMLLVGYLLFDRLPAEMPVHWNTAGEVDSYMPKMKAILLFPAITFVIILLFPLLRKIDPRKDKYILFERPWIVLQTTFVLFFAYIYFITLYITFHPEQSVEIFILAGIGVLFILIGNYLGKIRQNYFIGIKTPWTLNNEEVWNKTHRLAGWCFVVGGLLILINAFLGLSLMIVTLIVTAFVVIVPIVYSYLIYQKLEDKKGQSTDK